MNKVGIFFLLAPVIACSCSQNPVKRNKTTLHTKYGLLIYNSIEDKFKYFVPYKNSSKELGTGFSFTANNRLNLDLATIPGDTMTNKVSKKLNKFLGYYVLCPVKIIYEYDSTKQKVFSPEYKITINNESKKTIFAIKNLDVDVLKIAKN